MKLFSRISETISDVKKSISDSIPAPVKKYGPAVAVIGAVAATAAAVYFTKANQAELIEVVQDVKSEFDAVDNYKAANPGKLPAQQEMIYKTSVILNGVKKAYTASKAATMLSLVATTLWIASGLSVFYFWMNPVQAERATTGVKFLGGLGMGQVRGLLKARKTKLEKQALENEIKQMVREQVQDEVTRREQMKARAEKAGKSNGNPNPLFNATPEAKANRAARRANKKGQK